VKAVSCSHAQLELVDLPNPSPVKGQLLLEVLRCGIFCGEVLDYVQEVS
jgi:hypothetical protein